VVHIPKILAGGIESRYYGAGVELMDINERIGVQAGWTGHVARCPATPQRTLRRRPGDAGAASVPPGFRRLVQKFTNAAILPRVLAML
jgi:hypothetical protein